MPMVRLSRTTHGPVFESRNRGSSLGEFGVPATPTGHPVAVSRKKHAGPALRAVRPLPGDPVAIDLVELPLEASGALFFLRLGHHFASFFLPSGFFSAFFSSFFSSFFSAGFFSSLPAGFFFSFGAPFFRFASGFPSPFRASALRGPAGLSPFSAPRTGARFSRFGAPLSFSPPSICLLSVS